MKPSIGVFIEWGGKLVSLRHASKWVQVSRRTGRTKSSVGRRLPMQIKVWDSADYGTPHSVSKTEIISKVVMTYEIFDKVIKDSEIEEFDKWLDDRRRGTLIAFKREISGYYCDSTGMPRGDFYHCQAAVNLP